MINPILYQNQVNKYPEIYNDYQNLSSALNNKPSDVAFEALPVYGRISSLPDKLDKKDYLPATGIATLAILNGPEEINDVMSAYKQIKNGFPKPVSFHSGYDNKKAQHPFSFFRGTILHKYLNPLSEDCPNPKLASWLIKEDKCLWDTKFGKWIKKKLNIETNKVETSIEEIDSTLNNKKYVLAKVINTNNPFKDITARALTRTTKLGTLALTGIEAAHVAHEVSNGKYFFEEASKSAITLGVTTAATGVLGAIGAKYLGPTGSLIGVSTGALIGAITNNAINESF